MTPENLIAALNETRAETEIMLAGIDSQLVIYTDGGWRVQDIIAHLTAWEEQVLKSMQAYHEGEEYQIPNYQNYDHFNAQQFQQRQKLENDLVYQQWKETRQQLMTVLNAIPAEKWAGEMRYPSGRRGVMSALVEEILDHEKEHREDIVKTLGSQP